MLQPGATVLIESGPPQDPSRKHLYVVVGRQSGPPAQVLVVPVSSIRTRHYDKTTVLNPGVHSFIRRASYINYRDAQQKSEKAIESGIRNGSLVAKEDINDEVLEQIRHGFRTSKFVKPFTRHFLDECDQFL